MATCGACALGGFVLDKMRIFPMLLGAGLAMVAMQVAPESVAAARGRLGQMLGPALASLLNSAPVEAAKAEAFQAIEAATHAATAQAIEAATRHELAPEILEGHSAARHRKPSASPHAEGDADGTEDVD